ncbi:hypothetical protein Tco_1029840 [Tanacetum coccineum]|uniref:Lectin n=1 Tax=Tanacetum coccineum TaxID=301880 RepID=A0ABQ5G4P0_9ASTR
MFVLMVSYFIRVMDPNSSLGIIFLGEDVVVILSNKVEGSGDWNSPEFQDTANSGQKKSMVFYQMDTEEVSNRFVAPCFVNGLEAYDAWACGNESDFSWNGIPPPPYNLQVYVSDNQQIWTRVSLSLR